MTAADLESRFIAAHMARIRPLLGIQPVEIESLPCNVAGRRRERFQSAAVIVIVAVVVCGAVVTGVWAVFWVARMVGL